MLNASPVRPPSVGQSLVRPDKLLLDDNLTVLITSYLLAVLIVRVNRAEAILSEYFGFNLDTWVTFDLSDDERTLKCIRNWSATLYTLADMAKKTLNNGIKFLSDI